MTGVKRFVSDTIIYGFTTIASRLLNFILTPIYIDRLKNAAAFGVLINLYAWMSLFNALLAFGMETTFFRYLQKVEPEEKGKVYNQAFLITLVTALFVGASLYMFRAPIANWLGGGLVSADYQVYVQLFIGILVADALAVVPFAKLRAEGRPIRYGVLKMTNIIVNIGANLVFLFLFPKLIVHSDVARQWLAGWFNPEWVLGNIILANLIASLTTLLLLAPQLRVIRLRADPALLRSMLGYSFPILIANISFIINEHLDKMMFPHLFPAGSGQQDDLGIYGAVSRLAVFIALFVTAFRLGAEPFFFAYAKNKNAKKTYADIMQYFVLFLVIGLLGIMANLDWLKYFINKSGDPVQQAVYWSGLVILPVLLFNYVLLGIYMNLSIWYKLTDQTRFGLYISVIGAVTTVILNILLIPIYSYIGAALSTTITYGIMASLSYFWGQKYYPIPYPVRKISLYLIFGLAAALVMQHVLHSDFWWSNSLFIACLCIVGYIERGFLIKLWNSVAARRSSAK